MQAVLLDHISKAYTEEKLAVNDVSLCLEPGEVFGFLGPNGAGKTTTIKLLTGILTPTGGRCQVMGVDPSKEPARAHRVSGVVTEHAQMYDHMTGLENLRFYGAAFGLSKKKCEERVGYLLQQLELEDAKDQKLAAYSTGMRQRLSLARALVHEPKVLFLDEPTSGLDPESAQNVHEMIRTLAKEQGITVFLCTHQLRYAQEICTRYGLLENGRLLAAGTLEELRTRAGAGLTLKIRASRWPENRSLPIRITDLHTAEAEIGSEAQIPQIVREIVEAGGDIYEVTPQKADLEDIYFALTKETGGVGSNVPGRKER